MITGAFRPSLVAFGRLMSIAMMSLTPFLSESYGDSMKTRSRIASA